LLPETLVLNQAPPQENSKDSKQYPLHGIEKGQPVHLGSDLLRRKLNSIEPEPGLGIQG
jgi:hypothetical protein